MRTPLPFKIELPANNSQDLFAMKKWCNENFGPRGDFTRDEPGNWEVFWTGRSAITAYKWHFKTEQDLVLFTLRWS